MRLGNSVQIGGRVRQVLVANALALWSVAAIACVCPQLSEEQAFADADLVFRARVTETEEHTDPVYAKAQFSERLVKATYHTIEVFKGSPGSDGELIGYAFRPGHCALPLMAGVDYLFFLKENSWVGGCGNSRGYFEDDSAQADVLKKLRSLRDVQR
jgi:hypothetical protein